MKRTSKNLCIAILTFASPLAARAAPPMEAAGTPNAALVYWLTLSDEKAKTLASADVLKLAADLRPLFADIPRLSSLPLDQLENAFKEQVNPKLRSNPLGEFLFPHFPAARRGEAGNQCRNLLLIAAVDVARRGPAALKNHRDPFGKGPFAYAAYHGGFELWSQWEFLPGGKPVGLRAGIRPGQGAPEGPSSVGQKSDNR